jgi:phosphatidylserine/phosphatidylglycerophosphate/cardiolipin synthase-like enzyme
MALPADWLLPFANGDPDAVNGDGRPWADGTAMAARARTANAVPWDVGCRVTPLVGGYEAMTAIREAFEKAITDAATRPAGQRGHVYIAGWRFNAGRDLSDANPWGTSNWTGVDADKDQTALGLLLRLMTAGVRVRVMIWLPTFVTSVGSGPAHVEDHYYVANAVEAVSAKLGPAGDPLGIVALDARTADGSIAGTHHQKAIVIRGPTQDVAFCGGVDLAFTRRDAPSSAVPYDPADTRFLGGDWQSGTGIPSPQKAWPPAQTLWPPDTVTGAVDLTGVEIPKSTQGVDLEATNVYGPGQQVWHDQHLKLEGPIVRTLEDQFCERWRDDGRFFDLSSPSNFFGGQVIFSSPDAIDLNDDVVSLPDTEPVTGPAGAASVVQMWRTIPWRDSRRRAPFQRAEFTVMGGISHAVAQAQELVWMFDQYFWSLPLARQLNAKLQAEPAFHLILMLPPYADVGASVAHEARQRALNALVEVDPVDDPVIDRVGVFNLWYPAATPAQGRGVYCHAKTHTYDGALLVCGSANLNRRSLACDSEIACAVVDDAVVAAHQQRLWHLLFRDVTGPAGAWPGLDLNVQGNGATFFQAFSTAANHDEAFVRRDHWRDPSPTLDNGVPLERGSIVTGAEVDHIYDPTSLDPGRAEAPVERPGDTPRPPTLDEVVTTIEKCEAGLLPGRTVTPGRRQSSDWRI